MSFTRGLSARYPNLIRACKSREILVRAHDVLYALQDGAAVLGNAACELSVWTAKMHSPRGEYRDHYRSKSRACANYCFLDHFALC